MPQGPAGCLEAIGQDAHHPDRRVMSDTREKKGETSGRGRHRGSGAQLLDGIRLFNSISNFVDLANHVDYHVPEADIWLDANGEILSNRVPQDGIDRRAKVCFSPDSL